jgi:hypothetical protein
MLTLHRKFQHLRGARQRKSAVTRLIRKLLLYLTGFLNRRIQPKTRKDSQKCGGEKYGDAAFTIDALTMTRPYANPFTGSLCNTPNAAFCPKPTKFGS